jgi:hypothetical protein
MRYTWPLRALRDPSFRAAKRILFGAFTWLTLGFVPAGAHGQQPGSPRLPKAKQSQLTLRNVTKDTVQVELRVGTAPDCAANPLSAVQSIPPGRRWLIATPRPICWRRLDVSPPAGASPWHRNVLAAGEHLELLLLKS